MRRKHRKRRLVRLTRLTRPVRYRLTTPVLEILRRFVVLLPHGWALALGRFAGLIAWALSRKRRRRSFLNLKKSAVGNSDDERRRIVRRMFQSLGMNALESLNATGWSRRQTAERVTYERCDLIHECLARGKGMILLTGHQGNWELMPSGFEANLERPLTVVMAASRNSRLNEWVIRQRTLLGPRMLTTNEGALPLMRALRRGETLGILADQDTTRARGIFVDFFGRPAYTPVGPALLLLKSGAVMMPMAIHRDADNPRHHTVHAGKPILPDVNAPEDEELRRITQEYTNQLEAMIRRFPEQWVWMHQRWRHRPGEKIRVRGTGRRARIS